MRISYSGSLTAIDVDGQRENNGSRVMSHTHVPFWTHTTGTFLDGKLPILIPHDILIEEGRKPEHNPDRIREAFRGTN
jgi:hypothetical protein